jgi:hypothetical protein
MNFKRGRIVILGITLTVIALLSTRVDTVSEINAATGAIRTRSGFAFLPMGPWKETPTWASERAQRLGIDTSHAWQYLGSRHRFMGLLSRACGDTPASHVLKYLEEEIPEDQHDAFVRQFAAATEVERDAMIKQRSQG